MDACAPADPDYKTLFAASAAQHDRDGSFPFGHFERLHYDGVLALTAAAPVGGGAGLSCALAVIGDVAQGCASTALVLAMQLIYQHVAAHSSWPAHLRDTIARAAAERGGLLNALRVEPELGSPSRGGLPATIARAVPGGWRLSGHKRYCTGAPGLSFMLVWARTDGDNPSVGLFLVPAGSPGIRPAGSPGICILPAWDQLGLRASGSDDVLFDDVALPADHALDIRPPAAWGAPDPDFTAWSNLAIAALYTGVAVAARDWLSGFLQDRAPSSLGAPLASLPRMQEAMGQIDGLLLANQRLVGSTAADYDRGIVLTSVEYGLIKTVVSENAIAAVQNAMALTSNHGLARANPLERHLRDVLCARVHTPQPDAAYAAAGRARLQH